MNPANHHEIWYAKPHCWAKLIFIAHLFRPLSFTTVLGEQTHKFSLPIWSGTLKDWILCAWHACLHLVHCACKKLCGPCNSFESKCTTNHYMLLCLPVEQSFLFRWSCSYNLMSWPTILLRCQLQRGRMLAMRCDVGRTFAFAYLCK